MFTLLTFIFRIRRVKCGEEKPFCFRCIKFGIECDGYEPPLIACQQQVKPKKTHLLLPKQDTNKYSTSFGLSYEPSCSLFSTEQDHRYFDIFCSKTAFEILPLFETGALRQILLQACVSEPSIRHAVVALGALDKTAESQADFHSFNLDDRTENPLQHHEFALRQYATAVKEMRTASAKGTQDMRTTLLTCLVILCFEAWNGNQDYAVRQIQMGLRLINAWCEELQLDQQKEGLSAPTTRSQDLQLDDELVRCFSKLEVQAISFAEESNPARHALVISNEQKLLENMPSTFTSLSLAEDTENAIVTESMRFFANKTPLPKPPPPKRAFPIHGWWGLTDPAAVKIQQTIMNYISRWHTAFTPLWEKIQSENPTEGTLFKASTLKLHIQTNTIALISVCSMSEAIWDSYTSTFSEMVTHASLILNIINSRNNLHTQARPKFSSDSHVIIPLHMIAHKCREAKIRRKAIELLIRFPRREGVWDSNLAARIGGWAMSVEEEFRDEKGYVPLWARIHGVCFERDREGRRAVLSCEQRVNEVDEECVVRRKIVCW